MKLTELKHIDKELVQCQLDNVVQLQQGEAVDVWQDNKNYMIAQDSDVNTFTISLSGSSIDKDQIERLVMSDYSRWYVESQKECTLWLSVILPEGSDINIDIDIGVNEYVCNQLYDKGYIAANDIQQAIAWINDEFLTINGNKQTAFTKIYSNQQSNYLHFMGRNHVVDIHEINDIWQIEKLSEYSASTQYRLLAVEGAITFIEHTLTKKMENSSVKAMLKQHIESFGDYIAIWKQYSDKQWEDARRQAVDKIGYIKYTKVVNTNIPFQWEVYASESDISNFRANWDMEGLNKEEIQLAKHLPDYFDNHKKPEETGKDSESRIWRAKILNIEHDHIVIKHIANKETRTVPFHNNQGFLFLSVQSTLVQRNRQQNALETIQSKRNPIPTLHALLQGMEVPVLKVKNHRWKSAKVNTLFKHSKPTVKQTQAIEMALRSPDITVIIGPPGTGKTQVITALQQRLIEISQSHGINKSVLLTSYQHDAVDNALSRSNVLGLAGLRVGGKNKEVTEVANTIDTIAQWSEPVLDRIDTILAQDRITGLVQQLRNHLLTIRLGDIAEKLESKKHIDELLRVFKDEYRLIYSSKVMDWWQEEFKISSASFESRLLQGIYRAISALRTTPDSFLDDGMVRTMQLKTKLTQIQDKNPNITLLSEEDFALFDRTINLLPNEVALYDFEPLTKLKEDLLDRALPDFRTKHTQITLSRFDCQQLDKLYDEIVDAIYRSKSLGYLMVLENYKTALTNKKTSVKNAVSHYTAVLGATCQQSVGGEMQELKKVGMDSILFENVIVDEAARATPLDLMIPMAMAQQRIVLVGDHRQLSHMLDDNVKEGLFETGSFETEQKQMLEASLFQRLVTNFESLAKDTSQPKRVIMLDTQFRMHPKLGAFISQNFYENHGLPRVKSGRPTDHFNHEITQYENLVCAWKNIQGTSEQRPNKGSGWHRPIEAKWIATEVKRILEEKPELSIGIISFYRGQVDTLYKEMEKVGLIRKVKNDYVVHHDYASLKEGSNKGDERLRIGTVDAFQGKEFDIVFISLVRTLPIDFEFPNTADEKEKKLNQRYGFLRIDNRLNVAFSRQRSLLIVVGDTSLALHPETRNVAPSITNLLTLCGDSNGKVF